MDVKKPLRMNIGQHPFRKDIDLALDNRTPVDIIVRDLRIQISVDKRYDKIPQLFFDLIQVDEDRIREYEKIRDTIPDTYSKQDAMPIKDHPLLYMLVDGMKAGMNSPRIANKINKEVARLGVSSKSVYRFIQRVGTAKRAAEGLAMMAAQRPHIKPTMPKDVDEPAYVTIINSIRIDAIDRHKTFVYLQDQCLRYIESFSRRTDRSLSNRDHKTIQGYIRQLSEIIVAEGKAEGALDADGVLDPGQLKLVEEIGAAIREVNEAIWERIDSSQISLFLELWDQKISKNPHIAKKFRIPIVPISEETRSFVISEETIKKEDNNGVEKEEAGEQSEGKRRYRQITG